MALTRDFKETVKARAARDPAFARAMLDEAATAFLNGEPETARLILRDLVNASLGFETLAAETDRPAKTLDVGMPAVDRPSGSADADLGGAERTGRPQTDLGSTRTGSDDI